MEEKLQNIWPKPDNEHVGDYKFNIFYRTTAIQPLGTKRLSFEFSPSSRYTDLTALEATSVTAVSQVVNNTRTSRDEYSPSIKINHWVYTLTSCASAHKCPLSQIPQVSDIWRGHLSQSVLVVHWSGEQTEYLTFIRDLAQNLQFSFNGVPVKIMFEVISGANRNYPARQIWPPGCQFAIPGIETHSAACWPGSTLQLFYSWVLPGLDFTRQWPSVLIWFIFREW